MIVFEMVASVVYLFSKLRERPLHPSPPGHCEEHVSTRAKCGDCWHHQGGTRESDTLQDGQCMDDNKPSAKYGFNSSTPRAQAQATVQLAFQDLDSGKL